MGNIIRVIFFFLFLLNNLFASIIYEKDEIVITSLDVEFYKNYYLKNNNKTESHNYIFKKIYLIKKTLKKIREKNPKYVEAMNKILNLNSKSEVNFYDEIIRYSYIRNEFIRDYYLNKIELSDIKNLVLITKGLKIPTSSNNCLTIDSIINIEKIPDFEKKYLKKIKDPKFQINYKNDNIIYDVCINETINQKIENNLVSIIEKKTESDFKKFIYED